MKVYIDYTNGINLVYVLIIRQKNNKPFDICRIFTYLVIQLFFGNHRVKVPSQCGQNRVPGTGTDSGIQYKFPEVHFCQSGRNGNQMTNAGNETACQSSCNTMLVEKLFTLFHFLLI